MCYTFVVVVDGGFGCEVWKGFASVVDVISLVVLFDSAQMSGRGGIDSIE